MLDEVVADEKTLEEWIFDKKTEVIFALYDNKEVGSVPMISEKVEAGFSIGSWLVGIFAGLLEKI